jgi:sigma-B regulation protein RsbU (phosphoserine phosphatase)
MARYQDNNTANSDKSELNKRLFELSALFEISKTLNSTLNLKSILDNILLVPMGRMMISRGIVLFGDQYDNYTIQNLKGLPESLAEQSIKINTLPAHSLFAEEIEEDDDWAVFFKENKISLIIPLLSNSGFKGIIGYGKKLVGGNYTTNEVEFLVSISNIAVQAIENAKVLEQLSRSNRNLDQKVQELNTLFEIGKELNRIFDREKILKQLSFSLMGQLLINQFQIILKENDALGEIFKQGALFPANLINIFEGFYSVSEAIEKPLEINENIQEHKALYEAGVRVIVPLISKEREYGYLFIGEKLNKTPYTSSDFEFLSTIANIAVISLDNARMIEEIVEKKRLEEELNLARNIQARLLPSEMPKIEGYNVHAVNIASKMVGGDYFDVIPINSDEYVFAIADVSGKGMPASLLMSNLQAGLQILVQENKPLNEITARLNNLIYQNTSIEKYITFFILKLNVKNGRFEYVNAGHNPPYLFHADNEPLMLEKGGLILGMMPDIVYESGFGKIRKNDCLLMFTDGVTECMDSEENEFEEQGLLNFLNKNISRYDSKELNSKLIDELYRFAGDPTENDDITLLTIMARD